MKIPEEPEKVPMIGKTPQKTSNDWKILFVEFQALEEYIALLVVFNFIGTLERVLPFSFKQKAVFCGVGK